VNAALAGDFSCERNAHPVIGEAGFRGHLEPIRLPFAISIF
jgi:hypothetical protein